MTDRNILSNTRQVLKRAGRALMRRPVPHLCVYLIITLLVLILLAFNFNGSVLIPYLAVGILPLAVFGAVYTAFIRPGEY